MFPGCRDRRSVEEGALDREGITMSVEPVPSRWGSLVSDELRCVIDTGYMMLASKTRSSPEC
jgi:hypothetical protein